MSDMLSVVMRLIEGRDKIKAGWIKKTRCNWEKTAFCALGAIDDGNSLSTEPVYEKSIEYLVAAMTPLEKSLTVIPFELSELMLSPAREIALLNSWAVASMNNHPDTSHEDIVALFDRAVRLAMRDAYPVVDLVTETLLESIEA